MIFEIILAFSAFFISLIGTKLVILTLQNRALAPDIKLLTGKREAKLPDNGGIAVSFALIIGFIGAEVDYRIIASIFLLTGLPLLSAIIPIPKIINLGIRLVVVAISVGIFHAPIFSEFMPPLLDKTLAVFLWLWITHSFDKLEKIDGLLPIEMISIGLGLYFLMILSVKFPHDLAIYALIFATTGFGFLWWNYHPAKVLAGEIASIPVGFVAGYLLIFTASSGYVAIALILPAYFLADSLVTFFNRKFSEKLVKEKEAKSQPPYCFRAMKNSNSPKWVVRTITGINMLLVWLATQILLNPYMMVIDLIIAYSMVFALIWIFSRIKNKIHL